MTDNLTIRNSTAELFGKGRSTINEHILNIYKDGKLDKESSMRKIGKADFSKTLYNLVVN